MFHAFDTEGILFNKDGIFKSWWSKEEIELFKKKQEQIMNYYKTTSHYDNIKINTELTLDENLADIGGFMISEKIYINYLIEHKIYGEEQHKYLKQFYTYYARHWRNIYKSISFYDTHSITKYRVNCVLEMSSKFNEVYNIQKGNKMFINSIDKIW